MNEIGIGIVGAGVIAGTHAAAVLANDNARIVSVFDVDRERADRAHQQWGGPRVAASLEELVAAQDIDAVIVCTPPSHHAAPTIAALEHGKHVLCEKPLALNVSEAEAMVAAAERSAAFLACASSRLRLGPRFRIARRMIESGELGDVYHLRHSAWRVRVRPGHHYAPRATWFLNKSLAGGGVIIDVGVYAIDAALWMLGDPDVISVTAQTRQLTTEVPTPPGVLQDVEDHGVIMLQCAGGKSVLLETAWVSNMAPPEDVTIHGTRASLRFDPFTKVSARQVNENEYDPILDWQRATASDETEPVVFRAVEERMVPGASDAMFPDDVTREFLNGVASGTQPHTSGREALKVTKIIDAAYRSAVHGGSATLAP